MNDLILVVEDGTGIPSANSYCDLNFIEQYAAQMGSDVWCNNVSKQILAAINASFFLDLRYGNMFKGIPLNVDQGLLYPRRFKPVGCNSNTSGIPRALKMAQAALALQFLTDGVLDLNANATAPVIETSVSVGNGAVSETIKYAKPVQTSYFSVADGYIRQLNPTFSSAFVPVTRG